MKKNINQIISTPSPSSTLSIIRAGYPKEEMKFCASFSGGLKRRPPLVSGKKQISLTTSFATSASEELWLMVAPTRSPNTDTALSVLPSPARISCLKGHPPSITLANSYIPQRY